MDSPEQQYKKTLEKKFKKLEEITKEIKGDFESVSFSNVCLLEIKKDDKTLAWIFPGQNRIMTGSQKNFDENYKLYNSLKKKYEEIFDENWAIIKEGPKYSSS